MLNAGPPSTPHLQWSHLHRRLFSVALGILFWRIFVDSQEMCTAGGRGRQGEAGEVGGGRGRQDEAREKNQESWERGGSDVRPGSVLLSQALPCLIFTSSSLTLLRATFPSGQITWLTSRSSNWNLKSRASLGTHELLERRIGSHSCWERFGLA